jgi:hypothetical protein
MSSAEIVYLQDMRTAADLHELLVVELNPTISVGINPIHTSVKVQWALVACSHPLLELLGESLDHYTGTHETVKRDPGCRSVT